MLQLYKNNFEKSQTSNDFAVSDVFKKVFIQQKPDETWFQTTYLKENIAFGGNLIAELVDCWNTKILDITDKFYYNEFTDEFGIKQINYEFGKINIDYYTKKLQLKLIHTQSDNLWYSNAFYISNYKIQLTERFDYKNTIKSYFKSIRYLIYKNDFEIKSEVKTYTQTNGQIISLKATDSEIVKLKMNYCDNLNYSSLTKILKHDLCYLSGIGISDKPMPKKGERIDKTNYFLLDLEVNLTENYINFVNQLFEDWTITPIAPTGNYTLNQIIPNLSASFNKTTNLGIGNIKIYNSSNILVQSFNQSEMTLINNILTVNTAVLIGLPIDNYYINVDAGLFVNETQTLGINNKTDWIFSIINGDFDNNDFDNNEFLT